MKIAIIGAGYAGLSLAYYLKKIDPLLSVTLFYEKDFAKSSSFISTGLLQPYVGKYLQKSWMADEGIEKTKELLLYVEKYLRKKIFLERGVVKVAYKPFQKSVCRRVQKKCKGSYWFAKNKFHPEICFPSLFIPSGISVYSDLYLIGLKTVCEDRGVVFMRKKILETKYLADYSCVILCAGAGLVDFAEGKDLPVEKIKGQTLTLCWPKDLSFFPCSVISEGHVSFCKEKGLCQIGSTYERDYIHDDPDEKADTLIKKIGLFFPKIYDFAIVKAQSGIRLTRKNGYKPLAFQATKKVWIYGALGSRGLLYHALISSHLAKSILKKQKLLLDLS